MNSTAEVYLWGTRIGIIHQDKERPFAAFEYDEDFVRSGIELSPITMPLSRNIYEFPMLSGEPFYGMPGLVADSLPDTFGNKVIERWLASKGHSLNEFTAIDRLCYTGSRGMGALEYVPAITDITDIDDSINVEDMVRFASDVLNEKASVTLNANDQLSYAKLVQVGSSAGGARAKAVIAWNRDTNEIRSGQLTLGNGFDYWLMKFDNVSKNGDHGLEDKKEYTLIEYSYYKMALDCGINMSECRMFRQSDGNHFMTKRFDRENGKKIHMQSLGALSHISYKEPGLCSYELASRYMREIGIKALEIEEFYRRMVFNCLAVNQDDHVKNVSLLMGRNGEWRLSPAYDLTFSYNLTNKWLRAHQMTINNKNVGISTDDLIAAGAAMEIKKRKCLDIIDQVTKVVNNFEIYAHDIGVQDAAIDYIKRILEENRVK